MIDINSADFIGLPEDEATIRAYNGGFDRVRITRRDQKIFVTTRDYRTDRINFEVEENFVVAGFVG